ncbi:CaiB/BaiF CoA transferase family protein [Actinomadura sp. LOL_016]|uniref:CaiB/BaiF CoA transferase family protein n=1 Tax=unclassified Actinomadura TaxID=2626254 RepID=UPI003A800914
MAPGPLDGISVVDLTMMIAGPHCTRMLADAGAEVIKIEPPEGDPMRRRAPLRDGHSAYFGQFNTGKRSVVLDLTTHDGRGRALELISEADVLVENYRPGVMRRFGLDYETCALRNPRLVYCSISGYGQTGPKAAHPAYAPIIGAACGFDLANLRYQRDQSAPAAVGTFVADLHGGVVAYAAVVTALHEARRSGAGDHLDVALFDLMLTMLPYESQAAQFGVDGGKTVYRPVRAADGFVLIAAVTDRNFRALAAAMERPDLITDPRFAAVTERELHWEQLQDLIADWVRPWTAAEVERHMHEHEVPCTRYRTLDEALADEQVEHRGLLRPAVDESGPFRVLGTPYRSRLWPRPEKPLRVDPLGAHTDEVLGRRPNPSQR